jgi:hypothetical protein
MYLEMQFVLFPDSFFLSPLFSLVYSVMLFQYDKLIIRKDLKGSYYVKEGLRKSMRNI